MKNIIKIIPLLILLAVGIFVFQKTIFSPDLTSSPLPVVGANTTSEEIKINIDNKEYTVSLIEVGDINLLKLIPNFSEKLTANDAKVTYGCKYLTSGGFYLEDNSPTGLFISDGNSIKGWTSNKILNGVLSVNDFDTPRITFDPPQDHLRIAIQTGPVIIENALKIKPNIVSDEPARRILAGITGENKLYFMAIYNADQVFDGPNLKDLSDIVLKITDETKIVFADVVNLDGGSASAFFSESADLPEISPVGSFFCIK